MSLLIDSLSVSSFRGIGAAIEIDLSAPLTLLYAPNGSGKTSIFRALRWLIHEQESQEQEIRHRSETACDPRVAVTGSLREQDGNWMALKCERIWGSATTSTLGQQRLGGLELFRKLAQSHDLRDFEARGGAQKARYQRVLGATRFLSSDLDEAMALHGENSSVAELRQLLFSDLTSTTNLTVELGQTKIYKNKLVAENRRIRDELPTSEARLLQKTADAAIDINAVAVAVAGLFDLVPAPTGHRDLLDSSQRQLDTWTASTLLHTETLAALRPLAIRRAEDEESLPVLDTHLAEALRQVSVAETSAAAAESDVTSLRAQQQTLRSRYRALEERTETLTRLLDIDPALGALPPLAQVSEAVPSAAVVLDIAVVVADLPRWTQLLSDLQKFGAAIERTQSTLAQHPQSTLSELEEAEAALRLIEDALRLEHDQREELRRLALKWQQQTAASRCPCCEHDWGTAAELAEALSDSTSTHTHAVTQRIELRARIAELRSQREVQRLREDELQKLKEQERSLIEDLAPYRQRASALRIDLLNVVPEALIAQRDELVAAYTAEALTAEAADTPLLKSAATLLSWLSEARARLHVEISENEQTISETAYARDAAIADSARLQRIAADTSARRAGILARLQQGRAYADRLGLPEATPSAVDASQALLDTSTDRDVRARVLLQGLRDAINAVEVASAIPALQGHIDTLKAGLAATKAESERAERLASFLSESIRVRSTGVFGALEGPISEMFGHMQVNRTFKRISLEQAAADFSLSGMLDDNTGLDPLLHFSQGQQQDLALAMFLARAATLGGSFFLDEPLRHLDDLNRAALLDVLRAAVIGTRNSARPLRLLVTTASRMVLEHLVQKFQPLMQNEPSTTPLLRAYELQGNPRTGVKCKQVFPLPQPGRQRPSGDTSPAPPPEPWPLDDDIKLARDTWIQGEMNTVEDAGAQGKASDVPAGAELHGAANDGLIQG